MSANVPTIPATGESIPDQTVLDAELRELSARYPEPVFKDAVLDAAWFYERVAEGDYYDLFGKVVAVFERQVVGVGDHEDVMRIELSRKFDQHPARFYLTFLGFGPEYS